MLLEAGARRVYAVDAGHGQLLGSLRLDPRVVNLEATNVGRLSAAHVPEAVEVVTVDVSYLSLAGAVAQVNRVEVAPGADLVGLVKPMFELRLGAPPESDAALEEAWPWPWRGVESAGWRVTGTMPSPGAGGPGGRGALPPARGQKRGRRGGAGGDRGRGLGVDALGHQAGAGVEGDGAVHLAHHVPHPDQLGPRALVGGVGGERLA